jgi:hypothetical protein
MRVRPYRSKRSAMRVIEDERRSRAVWQHNEGRKGAALEAKPRKNIPRMKMRMAARKRGRNRFENLRD